MLLRAGHTHHTCSQNPITRAPASLQIFILPQRGHNQQRFLPPPCVSSRLLKSQPCFCYIINLKNAKNDHNLMR